MFRGNSDRNSIVSYTLLRPFRAQYVRIHPKAWRSHISMRAELYGCQKGIWMVSEFATKVSMMISFGKHLWYLQPILLPELTRVCSYPVGIQSGRIKNIQITASSMWNKYHAPYFGRLKRVRRSRYMGGWSARHNNHRQWIQVDLRRIIKLTMISTQGRKLAKQWVTRYTVSYSVDCVHFVPYKQRDRLKVRRRRILAEVTIKEHFSGLPLESRLVQTNMIKGSF